MSKAAPLRAGKVGGFQPTTPVSHPRPQMPYDDFPLCARNEAEQVGRLTRHECARTPFTLFMATRQSKSFGFLFSSAYRIYTRHFPSVVSVFARVPPFVSQISRFGAWFV
jgi:hypothetical protein